jgi:hypothetical protein
MRVSHESLPESKTKEVEIAQINLQDAINKFLDKNK